MSDFERLLAQHSGDVERSAFATWQEAQRLFDDRRYTDAARRLETLVEEGDASPAVRLLLARSYYHSAQLGRAITTAEALVADQPVDAYAHLLLGRALQRAGRRDEAAPHLRLAEAMGVS